MNDRRAAFLMLHYGLDYLEYAIKSLSNQVDDFFVLYTDVPSQGFGTDIKCPDTEEELYRAALNGVSGNHERLKWIKGRWCHQGEHCNAIWPFVKDYQWVVRFDADEIMPDGIVEKMIGQMKDLPNSTYQVQFIHFWKSFNWVCRDCQTPVRFFKMSGDWNGPQKILDSKIDDERVLHYGYCQKTKYIIYKSQVTDHRPEYKPTWFEDVWVANRRTDCHPVCNGMWNAEPFDKTKLPETLKSHPYYGVDLVE